MDINQFWQLIDQTREASKGDPMIQAKLLIKEVSSLSSEEIFEYERIFLRLVRRAWRDDLNDIADVIYEGLGDSGRVNFLAWLVGQGQAIYEKVVATPETLGEIVSIEDRYNIVAEALLFVGSKSYYDKTGSDDFDPIVTDNEPAPEVEGLWKGSSSIHEFLIRFEEKYPQIWARFGWEHSQ
jgi:hypothetical protein